MIHKLLFKQLNQELIAAAQLSYLAGIIKNPEIKALLLEFAKEELEHFKSRIRSQLTQEIDHKAKMGLLLNKAKENIKNRSKTE